MLFRSPIVPFVTALYQKLLGRNPDAAGLAINSNALRTGVTRQALVLSFLNGSEYIQKQVRAEYIAQLGTVPNSAGLSFWANQMCRFGYGSMVVGLASSNQAYARAQTNSV